MKLRCTKNFNSAVNRLAQQEAASLRTCRPTTARENEDTLCCTADPPKGVKKAWQVVACIEAVASAKRASMGLVELRRQSTFRDLMLPGANLASTGVIRTPRPIACSCGPCMLSAGCATGRHPKVVDNVRDPVYGKWTPVNGAWCAGVDRFNLSWKGMKHLEARRMAIWLLEGAYPYLVAAGLCRHVPVHLDQQQTLRCLPSDDRSSQHAYPRFLI